MLSNSISLIFWYNYTRILALGSTVVNCFQILYLWYSDTTIKDVGYLADLLWIAFKFYIFDILIQRIEPQKTIQHCCELLSNSISLIFWYNLCRADLYVWCVVNCFQILYLWYSDTTSRGYVKDNTKLWIAFKFYIFDILIQLKIFTWQYNYCCELLSNSISLIFWYNTISHLWSCPLVVNCFQILYLWYSDTTWTILSISTSSLWIAFKFYIFDILIQLLSIITILKLCCELLSNSISLIFWYNSAWFIGVVNELWIAFKFYIFDILIQHIITGRFHTTRCELLSNSISLIFWYNQPNQRLFFQRVVNCFQILYLWYSDTTNRNGTWQRILLWIAFKFYIFDILIQLDS